MGKTTVANLIALEGAALIDTDIVARQLVEPGQPALAEIADTFGAAFLDESGALRRAELARIVFASQTARSRLEAILHPRIAERWKAQAAEWRRGGVRIGAVVIPLLFEIDAADQFDCTLCVACSAATQRVRLASRGWTTGESEQRLLAQWPIEKKIALSDYVVWTEGELEVAAAQVHLVSQSLNIRSAARQ